MSTYRVTRFGVRTRRPFRLAALLWLASLAALFTGYGFASALGAF